MVELTEAADATRLNPRVDAAGLKQVLVSPAVAGWRCLACPRGSGSRLETFTVW